MRAENEYLRQQVRSCQDQIQHLESNHKKPSQQVLELVDLVKNYEE
jgi:hypothetical protein